MKRLADLTAIILLLCLLPSCHVGRFFYYNFANLDDYRKFPANTVKKGSETYFFPRADEDWIPRLPQKYDPEGDYRDLDHFMEKKKTVAFIVIQEDTIRCERYYNGYSQDDIVSSFSISKSFLSALVGIAIRDGYIDSTGQKVSDFLDGFKHREIGEITLDHLMNMRSGIRYAEDYYNPFGEMAKFYYGTNLEKYTYDSRLEKRPDETYEYASVNSQITGMILEKSTGKTLPRLLEEDLWSRLGMQYDASWNMDSRKNSNTKAFCCINARAIDFAKFARLYLYRGNWEGQQVVPEWWIDESIRISNGSRDSRGYPYHYFWRVLEDGSFFAKGILGQYIYIDPSKQLIMIRFGKKEGDVDWVDFFRGLSLEDHQNLN